MTLLWPRSNENFRQTSGIYGKLLYMVQYKRNKTPLPLLGDSPITPAQPACFSSSLWNVDKKNTLLFFFLCIKKGDTAVRKAFHENLKGSWAQNAHSCTWELIFLVFGLPCIPRRHWRHSGTQRICPGRRSRACRRVEGAGARAGWAPIPPNYCFVSRWLRARQEQQNAKLHTKTVKVTHG